MPFSGLPVFQLSPRDTHWLGYASLLSQTYITFRALTATPSATETEHNTDPKTKICSSPLLSQLPASPKSQGKSMATLMSVLLLPSA
jgi:hypothetical protein